MTSDVAPPHTEGMKNATLMVLVALASGCSPVEYGSLAENDPRAPEWTRSPDLSTRIDAVKDRSGDVWGHPGAADSWTVVLVTDLTCEGQEAHGCAVYHSRTIYVDVLTETCIETTSLWHEVGHSAIGNDNHSDARWTSTGFRGDVGSALILGVPAADEACSWTLQGWIKMAER